MKVKSLSRVDSSRPHGLQPTRLLRPWDFLGKSTGVGCHCLLQTIARLLLSRFSRVRLCATPQTAAHQAPRHWDSPGKNTGVGCHFLLQYMKGKSESEGAQSCPTLHDPMDCSLPGSSVHGIFQARVLEWGAIAFSTIPAAAATAAKLLQSCPTLCNPIDGSPPGSSVPGIFQARILEWVAISFSSA